jgi:hypothetical protein
VATDSLCIPHIILSLRPPARFEQNQPDATVGIRDQRLAQLYSVPLAATDASSWVLSEKGINGEPVAIQRYICRSTCSALKDGMLPYRRLCSKELQQCLDQLQTSPENLPKASSSLGRAIRHFQQSARSLHLRMWLPLALSLDPAIVAQRLWQALRQHYGDITSILRHLAAYCCSSLLYDYQSLAVRS